MTVYILILVCLGLGIVFGDAIGKNQGIYGKKNNFYTFWYWLNCCLMIFILGLRADSFSKDYPNYERIYKEAFNIPWRELLTLNYRIQGVEPIFWVLSKIISILTEQSHISVYMVIVAAVTMIPVFNVLYKESKMPYLSALVLFVIGFYFHAFNTIRSCMVCGLSSLLLANLKQGETKKYCLYAILLSFIHNTALLLIPLYFVLRMELLTYKKISVAVFFSIVVGMLLNPLRVIVDKLVFDSFFTTEYTGSVFNGAPFGSVVPSIAILICLILMINCINRKSMEERIVCNGTYIWCVISVFTLVYGILSRYADLMCIYPCLFIPNMAYYFGRNSDFGIRNVRIVVFSFIIVFTIWFLFLMRESPYNPYMFIWESRNIY